jgi:hypothetical protein
MKQSLEAVLKLNTSCPHGARIFKRSEAHENQHRTTRISVCMGRCLLLRIIRLPAHIAVGIEEAARVYGL